MRGLGDLVQRALAPAVALTDKHLGTDLANCQGCHGPGGRQDKLNKAFPFR
jgi:hypothetical protein